MPSHELAILNRRVKLGDPHITTDDRDLLGIRLAIFEPIVRLSDAGEPLPVLAVDWNCSDDARTWTFQLRRGVAFHDGTRLGGPDVVASLRRVTEQDLGGEMASGGVYQSYLDGARFEALNDETVRITTKQPLADLLDILATIVILPRRSLDDRGLSTTGTGPYRLIEATEDTATTAAFPSYWGKSPTFEVVHWHAEPNDEKRVDALLGGTADLIGGIGIEARQTIRSFAGGARVVDAQTSLCVAFLCNLQAGPCNDRRVRQALNYGLNVDELIESTHPGTARRLNGPLSSLHFGYDPGAAPYPYDPEQARRLLSEAGYAHGLEIAIDVPSSLPDEAIELSRLMTKHYARIGLTTTVHTFEDRLAYAEKVRAKQIDDACCFDSSPQSTFRVLREKLHGKVRGPWWQGYANPNVDDLIDRAAATPDPVRRQVLYRQAYRLIRDDAPWIFLYNPLVSYGLSRRLQGWRPGANGVIRFA